MMESYKFLLGLIFGLSSLAVTMQANAMTTRGGEQESENSMEFVNYIKQGTVWEMLSPSYSIDPETNNLVINMIKVRNSIEGIAEISGTEYMTVWKSNETDGFEQKSISAYIRYDAGKVYCRKQIDETYTDILLYDFYLGQDESVNLYYDNMYPDLTASCSEISEIVNEGNNYTLMKMNIFGEINPNLPELEGANLDELGDLMDFHSTPTWIRGLGSTNGLFSNISKASTLDAVYHNGHLIYKPQQSGVENIWFEIPSKSSGAYHIDGTPFKEGDSGVCIVNGKKRIIVN